jgi:hypothetical protein
MCYPLHGQEKRCSSYLKMDDLVNSMNRPSVAEGLYGIKSTKMDLCEQLPVIGSCNLLDQPQPYLKHMKSCPRPERAIFPEVFLDNSTLPVQKPLHSQLIPIDNKCNYIINTRETAVLHSALYQYLSEYHVIVTFYCNYI